MPDQSVEQSSEPTNDSSPHPPGASASGGEKRPASAGPSLSQQPPEKKKKKAPKAYQAFNHEHELRYGLRVSARDAKSGRVSSVYCRFCVSFGREVEDGRKRRATENRKYFQKPFRTDNYVSHLRGCHGEKWKEYKAIDSLCAEKADEFFDTNARVAETTLAHLEFRQPYTFHLSAAVVEGVVRDTLLAGEEKREDVARALSLFKPVDYVSDSKAEAPAGTEESGYVVVVKNVERFLLCIGYLKYNASFNAVSGIMQVNKTVTGLSNIGSCTAKEAGRIARIVCAVNLEKLSYLLRSAWAFSIALDTSTVEGTGYLDLRARLCVNSEIENFHILAIPLRDRHTDEVMFNAMAHVLDQLCPSWRDKIVGVSTDGDRSMTREVKGVATRIEKETPDGSICRVWCGLNQLDLVMRRALKSICDDAFYGELTGIIGHLRRQSNLIEQMGAKCPTVVDTQWLSAGIVTSWLSTNRAAVLEHYSKKPARMRPSTTWWLVVMALSRVLREVRIVVQRLQGLTTLLSEQSQELAALAKTLSEMCDEGEMNDGDVVIAKSGDAVAKKVSMEHFVEDLGDTAADLYEGMTAEEKASALGSLGKALVGIVHGIRALLSGSEDNPLRNYKIPAVLPQELVKIRAREMLPFIRVHRDRLVKSRGPQSVARMQEQLEELQRAYKTETSLRAGIDGLDGTTPFRECWKLLEGKYPVLVDFVGGLATVFPGTTTVESVFSVIGWEKDTYIGHLTDFSLEGLLHARQFDRLRTLPSN